jgi:acetyl esterase/lipase
MQARLCAFIALIGSFLQVWVQPSNASPNHEDLVYAQVGGLDLKLDIYSCRVAPTGNPPPLVIWIHGGAWRSGSKEKPPVLFLLEEGFALASIDYRLSTQAQFPALLHDCKAAIRWLRANQCKFGYDATKIAVVGSSAGGHLAALVGTTNCSPMHEGQVGAYTSQSSEIQAVVDYYGPTNFETILSQSTPHGLSVRVPALQLLLGSQPAENIDLARQASPVAQVGQGDPPILILHGDQDHQVPINQSHELHHQYNLHGLESHLEVVHGGQHGGWLFYSEENKKLVTNFLVQHIH